MFFKREKKRGAPLTYLHTPTAKIVLKYDGETRCRICLSGGAYGRSERSVTPVPSSQHIGRRANPLLLVIPNRITASDSLLQRPIACFFSSTSYVKSWNKCDIVYPRRRRRI